MMDKSKLIKFCIVFLFGFLSANIIFYYMIYGFEYPINTEFSLFNEYQVSSPHDIITEKDIEIFKDKVVIKVDNPTISRYAPTGSMVPVFDKGANGIRITPKSPDDIELGDIISFKRNDILIVHRVVEKGVDEKGIYFITKGDDNNINDGKLRFEDIKYITVAVIW